MAFSTFSQFFIRFLGHSSWILRRAISGCLSGFVAWFFIPALSRVISVEAAPILYFVVTGLLGGAFLGTVDGMVEESTPKTMRGAMFGALGGTVGGLMFALINPSLNADQILWGISGAWAIAGASIGLTSALWERKRNKLIAGLSSGFLGGAIGAFLGVSVYTFLIQQYDNGQWFTRRFYEGLNGAIIGVVLWFAIGVAERFVIFKRTPLGDKTSKDCHHCHHQNALASWYCTQCGSVLQWSAPPAKLNLTPYGMLDRLQHWFRFLSRLSATAGVIAGIVVFFVCVPIEPFFAFVATLLVAAGSYSLQVIFSSLSESIQLFIKK